MAPAPTPTPSPTPAQHDARPERLHDSDADADAAPVADGDACAEPVAITDARRRRPATVTIANARRLPIGTTVSVAGIVTAQAGRLGTPPLIAIQDSSGGIVVKLPDGVASPARGARLEVRGPLADPYGQLELRPPSAGITRRRLRPASGARHGRCDVARRGGRGPPRHRSRRDRGATRRRRRAATSRSSSSRRAARSGSSPTRRAGSRRIRSRSGRRTT